MYPDSGECNSPPALTSEVWYQPQGCAHRGLNSAFESPSVSSFLFALLPALNHFPNSVCDFLYLHVICLMFHSVQLTLYVIPVYLLFILNENRVSCFTNIPTLVHGLCLDQLDILKNILFFNTKNKGKIRSFPTLGLCLDWRSLSLQIPYIPFLMIMR